MRRLILHILLAMTTISFWSCQKENMGDCFKSTGKTVKESRSLDYFEVVELDDRINLYVTYSEEYKLEVEAGENLQDLIITKAEKGLLKIKNDNSCNWVRSYKEDINVYLSTPILKGISYHGSGEVRFLNEFKTDHFRMNCWEASGNIFLDLNCPDTELKIHTGPADLYCKGKAEKLVGYTNGVGHLNLIDLNSSDVLAVNVNSGKLSVRSDSILNAHIKGNGNIYYVGDPSISLIDNSKGELIQLK